VITPFRFDGRIGRLPYAAWSVGVFFSQHVVVSVVSDRPPKLDFAFVVVPLRSLALLDHGAGIGPILALAWFLLAAWALAALAMRRASDANVLESIAVLAIAPLLQVVVIPYLALLPSRAAPDTILASELAFAETTWRAVVQAVAAGIGLTLAAVIVGALVFGVYGLALFILSPCVIGVVTAYLGNRSGDLGARRTNLLVLSTALLGGAALIAAALEGVVCIVLASPLGVGMALIGGAIGRSIALTSRHSAGRTLSSLAAMPLIFATESAVPPSVSFDSSQTIEVAAPPEVVWKAMVHMAPLDEPVALPFRLGLAYPAGGEIFGEGVGAVRIGVFSTGVAIERITEWVPNRKLAFVVATDPPAMKELSPYRHVHAPHVVGYFHTVSTSFELIASAGGGTTIVEETAHDLKLDPVFYWLPMAQWAVGENNARVLRHLKRDAERVFAKGQGRSP
jgi:uncharacterized membrane protein YhaH (DUF805 family)